MKSEVAVQVNPQDFEDNSQSNEAVGGHTPTTYTCLENCTHGRSKRKSNKDMIQCCLCATSFHYDCVGLKKNDEMVIWPCLSCRMMPSQIRSLQNDISGLIKTNSDLKECLSTIQQMLLTQNNKTAPDADAESDDEDEDEEVEPKGTLLLGDSIIRNVKAKSEDVKVNSMSGAKFCDLKKYLKGINPKKEIYSDLFIICGTNDVSTKRDIDKIARECTIVLQLAKQRATNIHLSSILPRNDGKVDTTKIDALNQMLVTVTNQHEVNFINNDKNFLYRDNSIDMSMLSSDGLHLSASGTGRLLSNLGVQEKAEPNFGNAKSSNKASPIPQNAWAKPLAAIPSPPPMPRSLPKSHGDTQPLMSNTAKNPLMFKGAKSSFSNFFPTPITVWNTTFKSTEHAYQFRKAVEMGQHGTADEIQHAANGWKAMNIAESIKTNDHWGNIKQSVMYQLLQVKAEQCPVFRQDLMASHGQMLIEDTTHEYWGRGRSATGLNMLGRLLMVLRDKLPESTPSQAQTRSSFPSFPQRSSYHRHPLPTNRNQQPRCFNCGERSHNVNTCRHKSPVQCYSCQNFGHKQKFCQRNAVQSR